MGRKPAAAWPLRWLMQPAALRRRLAFGIAHDHFADLGLAIPLTFGMSIPLDHRDALLAMAEIFVEGEYRPLLDRIPMPQRWLDIGSHRGYFSLWLEWERRIRGESSACDALLIDADPRAQQWFDALKASNPHLRGLRFLQGAVADAAAPANVPFVQRDGMVSSMMALARDPSHSVTVAVPRLQIGDLRDLLPPPYDLVKVDIEGAEGAFVGEFPNLLREARYLLIEWHEHADAPGYVHAELNKSLRSLGFGPPIIIRPGRVVQTSAGVVESGIWLYVRS